MSADAFSGYLEALFGRGWRASAASAMGLGRSTLHRHCTATVPPDAATVVAAWWRLRALGHAPPPTPTAPFPDLPADWPCQAPLDGVGIPAAARRVYGTDWRAGAVRDFGISRTTLWRQAASLEPSTTLLAGLRAMAALADLGASWEGTPMPPPPGSEPRARHGTPRLGRHRRPRTRYGDLLKPMPTDGDA